MPQGSKVLSFSIPQPRSAEWWPDPAQDSQASEATGELGKEQGLLSILLFMEDIGFTLGTILGRAVAQPLGLLVLWCERCLP